MDLLIKKLFKKSGSNTESNNIAPIPNASFVKEKNVGLTEEQLKWNKMWELWAEGLIDSPYAELMTYQSELYNGGHSQYFTNIEDNNDLQKDILSLKAVLPFQLKEALEKAYEAYLMLEENYDDKKAEEIMTQCDNIFYQNEEEINHMLEKYSAKIKL